MNNNSYPENGSLHKCVCEISSVISALQYAEADPSTGNHPANLLKLCINQLLKNVAQLNDDFGADWPENQ
ncbi:hypothetical protein BOM23_14735 [Erwinia sp. OLMDLW33]|nr:hypothetical protein BOM23_14735 [Erwinia sp. OLMDLW33]